MPLDLFSKTCLPDILPDEMKKTVNELKKMSGQSECLKKAYDILIAKYRGYRFEIYTKLFNIFENDINKLWRQNGFLHCSNINYILRTLLIKSDFFKEEDVRLKWTAIWYISPHQYLQARVDNKWINVDIWGYAHGIKFGDYAHGFH